MVLLWVSIDLFVVRSSLTKKEKISGMSKHGMSSQKASHVKRGGHLREQIFSNQFTRGRMSVLNEQVNYSGSSADGVITQEDFKWIISELKTKDGSVSIKGGNNFQFHLGNIPELIDYNSLVEEKKPSPKRPLKLETHFSSSISHAEQLAALKSKKFWEKYLKKGEILAIDHESQWHFFSLDDVIHLLISGEFLVWRILSTGRIKGDCFFSDGRKRVGITFEHRFEKNQSVLGAHGGGAGKKTFFPWLQDHLECVVVPKMIA